VFPISRDGLVYGWQARKVNPGPDEPRLLTKTGFNKSKHLLNYDKVGKLDSVILVEGPFDCVKVAQAGFGSVCSFGKEVSQKQIAMILSLSAEKIYVGLDPDAYREADEVIDQICLKKRVYRVLPPKGKKDFGECSIEEIRASIDSATEVFSKSSNLEIILKD
jgi:DNA primase